MAEGEGSFPNASSNDPAALDLSVGAARGSERRFASIDRVLLQVLRVENQVGGQVGIFMPLRVEQTKLRHIPWKNVSSAKRRPYLFTSSGWGLHSSTIPA